MPTVDLLDKLVGIGTCSGEVTDKFARFRLTPMQARHVRPPLIKECLANIECRVIDIVKRHNIVVLEAVAACSMPHAGSGVRFTPLVTEHSSSTGAGLTGRR